MEKLIILRVIAKVLIPVMLIFGLYVHFHAKYSPGGGFQAGVIIAAAIVFHALVFGLDDTRRLVPAGLLRFIAALGVLIYAGVGFATLALGVPFLDYNVLAIPPPAGQYMGIILVEAGVLCTVAAGLLLIFYLFAGRQDRSR